MICPSSPEFDAPAVWQREHIAIFFEHLPKPSAILSCPKLAEPAPFEDVQLARLHQDSIEREHTAAVYAGSQPLDEPLHIGPFPFLIVVFVFGHRRASCRAYVVRVVVKGIRGTCAYRSDHAFSWEERGLRLSL